MVRCRLCNQKFDALYSHLRRHSISTSEYRSRFPGAPLRSRKAKESLVQGQVRSWKSVSRRKEASQKSSDTWEDPNIRNSRLRGMRKTCASQEYRDRLRITTADSWNNPSVRRRRSKGIQESWQDPERRTRTVEAMRLAANTPKRRKSRSRASKRIWKDPIRNDHRRRAMQKRWKDPTYRRKVHGKRKWWKPEIALRDTILKPLGLWGIDAVGVRFYDHVDIPSKHQRGFSFNADFASKKHRLIIHVDGWYHYDPMAPQHDWRMKRDAKIDLWCIDNGWLFLRLTDLDIYKKPVMCRNMVRLLIKGRIIPVIE